MTQFEKWLEKVNEELKSQWEKQFTHTSYKPLTYEKGRKYIKIIRNGGAWGFVSMWEGDNKGSAVKKGDLLKAASWNQPAKHSRGNIFEGTDKWDMYGPDYLI